MSRIPRPGRDVRRTLARGASPHGTGEPRASQPEGQGPHLASRPGRDGLAARFIQDMAAGASVAADQDRPGPTTANSRWRAITMPRMLPRTIQLCIHCRQNPAGFWVSRDSDQTVRRPWCLSCCQDLDPGCYYVSPFE
jgi:hypothetical protein